MENKKLGMILIIVALLVGGTFIYFTSRLSKQSQELGCFDNKDCFAIESGLSISHIAIGIFSFMLALGFYMLFFNKTEKAILERLEKDGENKIKESKFYTILKALDPYEQKVIRAIKEQDGITQNTLRIRLDMSKAKLSYVLQELERRGLIKRIEKGKTLQIYLRI